MKRNVFRSLLVVAVITAMTLVGAGMAAAGPRSAPDYGDGIGKTNPQQNPQQLPGCDPVTHPDPVKCFRTGWAAGEEVHIVSDPFEGAGTGTVTFWCQSIVGFKYQIWVAGLDPRTTYTVTTIGSFQTTLGTFRTDPGGYGTLNGLLRLPPVPPPGYYLMLEVRAPGGSVVLHTSGDGQGFGVFPH